MTVGRSNATMQKDAQLQELIDELTSMHNQQVFLYDTAHKLLSEAGSIHHLAKAQRDRIMRLEKALRTHLDMPYEKQFVKDPNS